MSKLFTPIIAVQLWRLCAKEQPLLRSQKRFLIFDLAALRPILTSVATDARTVHILARAPLAGLSRYFPLHWGVVIGQNDKHVVRRVAWPCEFRGQNHP